MERHIVRGMDFDVEKSMPDEVLMPGTESQLLRTFGNFVHCIRTGVAKGNKGVVDGDIVTEDEVIRRLGKGKGKAAWARRTPLILTEDNRLRAGVVSFYKPLEVSSRRGERGWQGDWGRKGCADARCR